MSRAKILLVDDDIVHLHVFREVLEQCEYDVVEASSYDQAIGLIDVSVNLALVDIVLQTRSGLEILSYIHRKHPNIPVIMISAFANKNNAIDALHKGAVDYLEKPVHLNELKHVVERWLSFRTLRDENIRLREEQKLQHELRESELRYKNLIEAIPDAVLIVCENRIIYANRAAETVLKAANMNDLIGRKFSDIVDQKQVESVAGHLKHVLLEQASMPRLEAMLLKLDGEAFDAEFSITHTNYLDKAAVQLVVHDITRRMQSEHALQEQVLKLQRFNKMAVGREVQMIELKKEVNTLLDELERDQKYRIHNISTDSSREAG